MLIHKAVEEGKWCPFAVCRNGLTISNLFFADDYIICESEL